MVEHVQLDLTEAVEYAAIALAKEKNIIWLEASPNVKLKLREHVLPLVNAAAPFIIEQVWKDVSNRRYDVKKED